jgi:hypothetical protein
MDSFHGLGLAVCSWRFPVGHGQPYWLFDAGEQFTNGTYATYGTYELAAADRERRTANS